MGVIALLWLTTVANFGGPKVTGRIGSVTVWGVILPVGFMSIFGWFWFSGETFAAAWNPNGLSPLAGMGSSISLTLWAFLGLESASQNASAVENPKRDVPIACLFGTLGAAVIYVLSTTVIQGVVPNAELAASTGSFGTAFAQMFNPTIGSIVMGLAAMACVGSLLGWQFTIASVAKDAADSQMFPSVFGKANSMGAPIIGMIIMGVVQTLLALMTISPDLSVAVRRAGQPRGRHERGAVHPRAVGADRDPADRRHRRRRLYALDRDHRRRDRLQRVCAVRGGHAARSWAACS